DIRSRMRESASTDLREPQGSNPLGPPGPELPVPSSAQGPMGRKSRKAQDLETVVFLANLVGLTYPEFIRKHEISQTLSTWEIRVMAECPDLSCNGSLSHGRRFQFHDLGVAAPGHVRPGHHRQLQPRHLVVERGD